MKKLSSKELEHLHYITQQCYRKSVIAAYPSIFKKNMRVSTHLLQSYVNEAIYPESYDKLLVDEEYRKIMCNMSTEDIELIIRGAQTKQYKRAETTIQTLLTELLSRQFLENRTEVCPDEETNTSNKRSDSSATNEPVK